MGSTPLPPLRPWVVSQRLRSSPPLSKPSKGQACGLDVRGAGGGRSGRGSCGGGPAPRPPRSPGGDRRVGDGREAGGGTLSLGAAPGPGSPPPRSPALASSHPLPNPNSSSPASRALSFITNNNDAYRIAWTYPTSSDPSAPAPGPPPLVPGPSVREAGARPGRQAWARPITHLSVFALRVKPPGGVADASGFFLSVFVRFIYERIALGSGKGR